MEDDLLKTTLNLARDSKLPASRICKDNDVSVRWYYRFLAGEYKDPGVQRVQRLHRYLTESAQDGGRNKSGCA